MDSVSQRETENALGALGRSKQAGKTASKHTHTHTGSLAVIGQHCTDLHTYSLEEEGVRREEGGRKRRGMEKERHTDHRIMRTGE